MTFEEWWATLETREQHRADKALTEEAFTTGAASRDAEIAELKDALGYDWDKYKAAQDSLREYMLMVRDKDAEVAELVAALEKCRNYMELAAHERKVQPYTEVCEALAKVRKP